jgi:hypothetical protein
MIPFGPWKPDIAAFDSAAAQEAMNVIPSTTGYGPFQGLEAPDTISAYAWHNAAFDADAFLDDISEVNARVQGAKSFKVGGLVATFCGDATALYKLNTGGTAWHEVTRLAGGDYATPSDGWWDFTLFGDYVIATNGVDSPQYFEVGTSTDFALLAGTPPIAKFCGVIRDFVVMANISSADTTLQWSGINDATAWTPSATTMSDSNVFPDGGPIMGFVGGEYGVVLQESAIRRMSFEGPPIIFRFDKITDNIGCRAERSIASYENIVFFLGNDGFYMLRGGSELTPIGTQKIDKWFNATLSDETKFLISATIDPIRKLYIVGFPDGSNDAACSQVIMYHWPSDKWSHAEQEHELIYSGIPQSGYTIDGLDALSDTIDGLTYPVDSGFYTGSARKSLAGFDTGHRHGYFTGPIQEATIETGDTQIIPGRKALLRGLRPMVEGTSVTPELTVLYRDRLQDSHSSTVQRVPANITGFCPVRVNARYHRARITLPSGSEWSFATGIDDIKVTPMGAR